ncbi:MAG: Jag N-terminal domain-containing protein [Microthrixaceae bacterium]
MEWIETTASTVEEARELALDQLGVDESEAEFEVIEEPKTGLFGRTRGLARVRVRIVPKAPRPKTERKRRGKKRPDDSETDSVQAATSSAETEADTKGYRKSSEQSPAAASNRGSSRSDQTKSETDRADAPKAGSRSRSNDRKKEPMDEAEQISAVENFLTDLAKAFDLQVSVESSFEDGDLRANVVGENLGLLVGPRLATLDAVQEITRTSLQRQAAGREYARVTVDVAGIRKRRSEALSEFVEQAAAQVRDDNVTVVFEVMSSVDRKQVHDTASELEGVLSGSEGEDPRRRVALRPAD